MIYSESLQGGLEGENELTANHIRDILIRLMFNPSIAFAFT